MKKVREDGKDRRERHGGEERETDKVDCQPESSTCLTAEGGCSHGHSNRATGRASIRSGGGGALNRRFPTGMILFLVTARLCRCSRGGRPSRRRRRSRTGAVPFLVLFDPRMFRHLGER